MDWLSDNAWAAWFGLAALLGVAELVSLDLVLVMLAAGAVAGGITSLLGGALVLSLLVAAVTAIGMLALVRPGLVAKLHQGPELSLGHNKLVGQRAVVITRITGLAVGQIKIGGETWTAAPYDEHLTIDPGATVEVFEIRGATAYVHPVAELE
jgi:membrane protein implicated in regulation of membrane protease activity